MRDNSFDQTIEYNCIQKWRFLIAEYEEVKAGRSTTFRSVGEFHRHHGTCLQTFRKYYNRYLRSGAEADLLPQRRRPEWREPEGIEAEIVARRKRGMNRYEIHAALRERPRSERCYACCRQRPFIVVAGKLAFDQTEGGPLTAFTRQALH